MHFSLFWLHRPANPVAGARRCCTSDRQKITPQSSGAGCIDGVCRHVPFFSSARIDDKGSFYPCGTDSNELCTLLFKHAPESAGADKRVGKSVWFACTPPHVPGRFLLLVNTGVLPNADLLAQFSAAEKEQNYSAWALTHSRASIPSA